MRSGALHHLQTFAGQITSKKWLWSETLLPVDPYSRSKMLCAFTSIYNPGRLFFGCSLLSPQLVQENAWFICFFVLCYNKSRILLPITFDTITLEYNKSRILLPITVDTITLQYNKSRILLPITLDTITLQYNKSRITLPITLDPITLE